MHLYVHHLILDVTAGFQDNEPLMRALSKLIYLNNPDLVLFVGEALVGNDAVDQLSKFNQVLIYIFCSSIFVQLQLGFCFTFPPYVSY
jgi:signal recognition particle receptor subunit alpha